MTVERDYIDARLGCLERELLTLKEVVNARIDDGELNRNEGLNRLLGLLREGLDRVEARANEKFSDRDKALERATVVLDERLAQVYAFRDQINSERLSYVTRDQLADSLNAFKAEIDLVKRAVSLSAGKESGVSKAWAGILIAFSILAALAAAVTALGPVIFRH